MMKRGYALPLALLLAGVLAAAFVVFLTRLGAATTSTTMALKRRQAFYVADAVSRAATDIAGGMLSAMPAPGPEIDTDAEVAAFFGAQAVQVQAVLDARRAGLAPPGYTINALVIDGLGRREVDTLSSGPFRGMRGKIQPFTIAVEVSHSDGLSAVSTMRSSIQRGTISMFQFWAFIDGYTYIYTGTGGKMAGRLHANGNVCMGGGGPGLYAEQVTSAGSFYVNRSSGCRREFAYHEAHTFPVVATRPLSGGIDEAATCNLADTGPKTSVTTGTTYNCAGLWARGGNGGTSLTGQFDRDGNNPSDGTGADLPEATWRTTATNRWGGMLQDRAHGVPVLKVPITGQPLVQAGRDASFATQKNNQNSRFLIDPMLPSEPDDVRAQKMAFRADIRILNGVWYVRDPAAPQRLGTPVWSDHLGRYNRRLGEDTMVEAVGDLTTGGAGPLRRDVGQADLFGVTARPRAYSYYRSAAGGGPASLDAYTISDVSNPAQRARCTVKSWGVARIGCREA